MLTQVETKALSKGGRTQGLAHPRHRFYWPLFVAVLLLPLPALALPPVPTPASDTLAGVEDQAPSVYELMSIFDDPEGQVLTFTLDSQSGDAVFDMSAGSVDPASGQVQLVPIENASGTQTFVFRATDTDNDSAVHTLEITLTGMNDTPSAQDDSATVDESSFTTLEAVIIDVLDNDMIGDPPVTIVSYGVTWVDPSDGTVYNNVSETTPTTQFDETGLPITEPNGGIALRPDNTLEYSPKANYEGTDFFTYTIRDADGEESTATVNITINDVDDVPRVSGTYEYTVNQGSFIEIDAAGGLLSRTIDDDGDDLQVVVITPPSVGTITDMDEDTGAFTYIPPPTYGDVGDPPVTFVVQFRELPSGREDAAAQATVTIHFDPIDDSIPIDPPGEVAQIFDLADVPLEDAISAEANVLVVMDDSGSMDWTVMVPGPSNVFRLNNASAKLPWMRTRTGYYYYTHYFNTNVYGPTTSPIPTEETLNGNAKFNNNQHGVWRAWNAQYNPIYYNPQTYYEPWTGLDRNGQDFADSNPTAALLDPFDVVPRTVNLTAENLSYWSYWVPTTFNDFNGYEHVLNTNVHLAHYYTTTAAAGALPAWNQQGQRVDIRANYTLNDGTVLSSYPGGPARIDCAVGDGNPNTCTYEQEIQNFANWFTYYRSREYTAKAALGRAVAGASNLRMGYSVLNKTNEREEIDSLNASYRVGQKKELMDQVYTTYSAGGTPLRRALDRAGRTFECVSGNAFFKPASAPGSSNCPVLGAPEGQCQNNFTLLFSDGEWNGGFSISNHDRDTGIDPSQSAFDGGKYEDNWSATLADIAMYYYERDLHPDLTDGVATTERDQNGAPESAFLEEGEIMHQHMKTYTVGFGLTGNFEIGDIPTDFNQSFAWPRPTSSAAAKIDDMLHAAVNGRGEFLQANNPVLLSQVFADVFEEFSDSSVSVSAVAFNSTSLREDTVEYRGFFNPKFHSGDLLALRVDEVTGIVDADNPIWRAAQALDSKSPANRKIVTWDDNTNSGKPFEFVNLNSDQTAVLDNLELDWIRGVRTNEEPNGFLRSREQTNGLLGDIVHSAPIFVGSPRAFLRDQSPYPTAASDKYSLFVSNKENRRRIVYVGANDGMLHGFDAGIGNSNGTGEELFAYVPNKIIDASEGFANELDQLTSLVYAHRFFVDLTPTVEDVFMHPSKSAASKAWTTLLVGGLGGGGKGYFAINVTDPGTSYASQANASDAILWEFTDQDDTYPVDDNGDPLTDDDGDPLLFNGQPVKDLGYALSAPQVVMTNLTDTDGEQHWAAIFGNGYNSTAGIGKLFILLVNEGMNGWQSGDFFKLSTKEGVKGSPDPLAGLPNGIGTPAVVDKDGNGTADYAYAGDLFGNLYRFDISSDDADDWEVTKLFQAKYSNGLRQPITTQPLVLKHPDEGFLVVFGTGSWVTDDDGVSTDVQSVYGIWDRFEVVPNTLDSNTRNNRLVEQVITNVADDSGDFIFERLRRLTSNAVNYQPDDNGGNPGVYGWYIDLDPVRAATTTSGAPNQDDSGLAPPSPQFPGERAIRRIVHRGDNLLITTVIPRDANTCFRAPPGSTFPIDALTGGGPQSPVFDLNNDGVIDDQDFLVINDVQYAAGILFDSDQLDGTLVDPSMLVGAGDHDFLFISGGDDQITIRIAPPGGQKTGRLSWRQLFND